MSTVSPDSVAADQIRAFFERWERLEGEKQAISDDLKELFAEAKGNGFDTKVLRKLFRDQLADANERSEFEALYDLYAAALNSALARDARDAREDQPDHDPETGEVIEPASGAGTVADGAGKPETSDASSADIPMSNASAQPNGADPRTPVDAATVGETADHSEPAEVPPPPPSAAPGDGSAAHPSAAPVVANVVQMRSHNPETHFLNSTGLSRLHGCLKPDMCGSSQPRAKLCFSCSVKHDGPTYQAVAE